MKTHSKDPSTGLGISDAFTQAFLLAEALGATLDGADWEGTMAAYHRKRDAAVLPSYQATIDFTREGPIPADALAWLRAISGAPPFVRSLARNLPAAAAAPGVYSPRQPVSLGKMSRLLRASDAAKKTSDQPMNSRM